MLCIGTWNKIMCIMRIQHGGDINCSMTAIASEPVNCNMFPKLFRQMPWIGAVVLV